MSTAVLTPFVRGRPQRESTGKLWWHKLLPVGDVEYRMPDGTVRMLNFTKSYNDGLQKAFNAGAYPQVPFQLADASNTHTNAVERFGGDIVRLDSRPDGLWVALVPTASSEHLLRENPRLGVSARIVEDYARSDGKFYPAAVQHVLGTLDPRIPSLGVWQPIEMSNQPERVLDLTGAVFAGQKDDDMPLTDAEQARLAQLLQIPDGQWQQLVQGLNSPALTAEELAALTGDAGADELTDDELEELLAAAADLDAQGLLAEEPAGVGMTADVAMAIDLANYRADEAHRQLNAINGHLAEQRYLNERRALADAGVPPYITDLAKPALLGTNIINLANGTTIDMGQVMRRVLTEFGRMGQMLDLTGEMGSGFDEPAGVQAGADQRNDVVSRFRAQTGI